MFLHKIPFKCVEISFSGLKKRGKFGENKTLPQVKKNKTKQNKKFTAESAFIAGRSSRRTSSSATSAARSRKKAMETACYVAHDAPRCRWSSCRRRRCGVNHDRVDRFERHLKVLSSVKSTVVAI